MRAPSLTARLALAAVTMGALLTSGCSDTTRAGAGRLSILLTDAPGDVHKAVVTISQIYLLRSGGDGSRLVLRSDPITTDLLTLANDTKVLVEDAVVPAGTYSELRFVVTGAYVEAENADGSTGIYATSPDYPGLPAGAAVAGALQMPSFAQSGLKVKLPGDAVTIEGEQKVLLVDFDVAQSFGRQAGQSGQWVMHPVVTATDFDATGSLAVRLERAASVTLPTVDGAAVTLGDFSASLTSAGGGTEVLPLTDVDADGVFAANFRFLAPGSYTVAFVPPAGVTAATTTPATPASLSIASGQAATAAFTLTGATAAP